MLSEELCYLDTILECIPVRQQQYFIVMASLLSVLVAFYQIVGVILLS